MKELINFVRRQLLLQHNFYNLLNNTKYKYIHLQFQEYKLKQWDEKYNTLTFISNKTESKYNFLNRLQKRSLRRSHDYKLIHLHILHKIIEL